MKALLLIFCIFVATATAVRVKSCYLCIDNCSQPMKVENCDEKLYQNRDAETRCISIKQPAENKIFKGCSYKDNAESHCSRDTEALVQTECYFCDKDLCNQPDSGAAAIQQSILLVVFTVALAITIFK